jgi:hypothetical protein
VRSVAASAPLPWAALHTPLGVPRAAPACCMRRARIRGILGLVSGEPLATIPVPRLRSPFSSHSALRPAAFSRPAAVRGLAGAAQFIPPPTTAVIAPSREALRLYREILRTAKGFWWEDDYGQPFGEQLAKSARREFEDWRGERDPEVIANRIMVRLAVPCDTYHARLCRCSVMGARGVSRRSHATA